MPVPWRISSTFTTPLAKHRHLQIARNVVQEEILEDVGTGVGPSRLASLPHTLDQPRVVARPVILGKQMLVRVYKGKRADLSRSRSVCVSTDDSLRWARLARDGFRPFGRLGPATPLRADASQNEVITASTQ
jgi:hypothetical protein